MPGTDDKPTATRTEIAGAIRELGLEAGDCVMVHSGLKGFGYVEGGPDALVDAVLDVIGPGGTAVFPTFTGKYTEDFDKPLEEFIYTGTIPKTARARDDFVKSYHPLYSICAKGPMAEEMCELSDRYIFAAADRKFLHVMGERGGKALLMGVDQNNNSSVHLIEEFADMEYKVQDKDHWSLTTEDFLGMPPEKQAELRRLTSGTNLDYGTVATFNAMDDLLKREGLITFGKVGNATLRLMKIADLVRVGLEEAKRNPWFLRRKVAKN